MAQLDYTYDDGGRKVAGFKGNAGDCVARAVAIAAQLDYTTVYNRLSLGQATIRRTKRASRSRSARSGVSTRRKWFKDYMRSLGFEWIPTMKIGTGCQVHLVKDEIPMTGRLVVRVSKHLCAVIDGVIHDTYNSGADRGTTIYPPLTPRDQIPTGAVWLANGNGWAYHPQRCVYGYWIFRGENS
jgi:hypothetical protein